MYEICFYFYGKPGENYLTGEDDFLPVELKNLTLEMDKLFFAEFPNPVKVFIVSMHEMHMQDTDRANKT